MPKFLFIFIFCYYYYYFFFFLFLPQIWLVRQNVNANGHILAAGADGAAVPGDVLRGLRSHQLV